MTNSWRTFGEHLANIWRKMTNLWRKMANKLAKNDEHFGEKWRPFQRVRRRAFKVGQAPDQLRTGKNKCVSIPSLHIYIYVYIIPAILRYKCGIVY